LVENPYLIGVMITKRKVNTVKNRKAIAITATLSTFFLILGATLPTFYINATVGAFFLVASSMLLLFSAVALYHK